MAQELNASLEVCQTRHLGYCGCKPELIEKLKLSQTFGDFFGARFLLMLNINFYNLLNSNHCAVPTNTPWHRMQAVIQAGAVLMTSHQKRR